MSESRAAWTSRCVVLRTCGVGESDLMVTLLTSDRGRVECAGRGARKSRKRFPGGLPVGAQGEAQVRPGRGRSPALERFDPTGDHAAIGRDIHRFAYVAYLCEITEQLVLGHGVERGIYEALVRSLDAVVGASQGPEVLRRYELELLGHLGLLPTLGACCVCGAAPAHNPAAVTVPYDVVRGGVLCGAHADAGTPTVDTAVLEAARMLQDGAVEALVAAPASVRRGVRDLCLHVVRKNLHRPLRSAEFFRQLAQDTGAREG